MKNRHIYITDATCTDYALLKVEDAIHCKESSSQVFVHQMKDILDSIATSGVYRRKEVMKDKKLGVSMERVKTDDEDYPDLVAETIRLSFHLVASVCNETQARLVYLIMTHTNDQKLKVKLMGALPTMNEEKQTSLLALYEEVEKKLEAIDEEMEKLEIQN